jgi:hypothetical protein
MPDLLPFIPQNEGDELEEILCIGYSLNPVVVKQERQEEPSFYLPPMKIEPLVPIPLAPSHTAQESDSESLVGTSSDSSLSKDSFQSKKPRLFPCSVRGCHRTFLTRKEQQNHIQRHSNNFAFRCSVPECVCAYTTQASLNLHTTRIHGEKKYKCSYHDCYAAYALRGDLNQHIKRKHDHTWITPRIRKSRVIRRRRVRHIF